MNTYSYSQPPADVKIGYSRACRLIRIHFRDPFNYFRDCKIINPTKHTYDASNILKWLGY